MIDVGARIGRGITRGRVRLRALLGLRREPRIVAFRGYGSRHRVRVKGRVEERPRRPLTDEPGSRWRVVRESWQRVTAPPVPDAGLEVDVGGRSHRVGCSVHGYFDAWIEPATPLEDDRPWHPVELRLEGDGEIRAATEILTPTPSARFAVISDIDDTVVPTGATSFLRMLTTTFFTDARARLPFPGVGAFYRALRNGTGGSEANPLVYVSRGPWSLYEVLAEMLRRHAVPIGPVLFLRKWGLSEEGLDVARTRGHKFGEITTVLSSFRDLPFILIGDSGQRDPEIYTEVVREHPGRVAALYLRCIRPDAERRRQLERLGEEVARAGSELVAADHTATMAEHAAARGFIAPDAVDRISARCRRSWR
ncbi:MAG TPA: phosphatase domain-containing protein [Candidatus Sulfomarinibacteraceae bacterium]|nr:phosphatase domain-containing protein [Candidatus Sulfomarinibacteraceae bacterium]